MAAAKTLSVRAGGRGGATQRHADARQQLPEPEGLRQVVVGPGIQGRDLLLLHAPRGEDEDGESRPFPEAFDHLHPIQVREAQIQDDQVRAVGGGLDDPFLTRLRFDRLAIRWASS